MITKRAVIPHRAILVVLFAACPAHGDLYTDGVLTLDWLVDSADEDTSSMLLRSNYTTVLPGCQVEHTPLGFPPPDQIVDNRPRAISPLLVLHLHAPDPSSQSLHNENQDREGHAGGEADAQYVA